MCAISARARDGCDAPASMRTAVTVSLSASALRGAVARRRPAVFAAGSVTLFAVSPDRLSGSDRLQTGNDFGLDAGLVRRAARGSTRSSFVRPRLHDDLVVVRRARLDHLLHDVAAVLLVDVGVARLR